MLRDFLTTNRSELIGRCRTKVAGRRAPRATPAELEHGIPLFLDQLTEMLPGGSGYSGPALPTGEGRASPAEWLIQDTAVRHGRELLRNNFTIDQVVHDYGDLCQSITELAFDQKTPISVEEFGMLNIRLDNAIAGAVTEFARQREVVRADEGALANERLGGLAHEMRNLLNTTILAIAAIKSGGVGFGGATAAALDRSLIGMRGLIDRTLAEVRLESGLTPSREMIEIGPFFLEVQVAASLEASTRGCELAVLPVERGIFVEADRHILAAAVANLLQNAFKFTCNDSHVLLRGYVAKGRVLIEVEDECGGLPDGVAEQLFRPFDQRNADRSGAGLGLSISRKGVDAAGGKLYVRNLPGRGCIFTIDLPRKGDSSGALSESSLESAGG